MKKIVATAALCLITVGVLMAQIKVHGTVTDASGKKVAGVIITEKGTKNGVVTDRQGAYELQVPNKNTVLEFLLVGVERLEKKCDKNPLNVQLNKVVKANNNPDESTIILYNQYGKVVAKKEGVKLKRYNPSFADFMSEEEFNELKPATYFYLLQKGKEQKTGYLKKVKGMSTSVLCAGFDNLYSEFAGYNFHKKKPYLEVAGKKTLLTDGMEINGLKIKLRKRRLKIEGKPKSKKDLFLWIGKDKLYLNDTIGNMHFGYHMSMNGHRYFRHSADKPVNNLKIITDSTEKNLVFANERNKSSLVVFLDKNEILYVIDGVPNLKGKALKEIDPDSIKNILVLKGKAASAIYGEQAKNGAIIITTKKASASIQKAKGIKCLGSVNSLNNNPLILVDGKIFTGDVNSIIPQNIKSTKILKDKEATALCGAKGKNGVIMITTKNKK